MTPDALAAQVAQEKAEIATAPRVPRGPALSRCHFCGQLTDNAQLVETLQIEIYPNQFVPYLRYKGGCCG